MQSKKHSHYETIANQIAGQIIAFCIVYFAFPLMGIEPTVVQAGISSVMFFCASYTRAYVIRRIFNQIGLNMMTEDRAWQELEKKIGAETVDCRNQVTPNMRAWFRDKFDHKADDETICKKWREENDN